MSERGVGGLCREGRASWMRRGRVRELFGTVGESFRPERKEADKREEKCRT